MSQMKDVNITDKALEKLTNVVLGLEKAYYDGVGVLKLEHMYGYWGMQYNFQFGYFLNALPPVVTILMFVIFKRKKTPRGDTEVHFVHHGHGFILHHDFEHP